MTGDLSPADAVRRRLHENENNLADMLVRKFDLSLKEAHQIIAEEKSKRGGLPITEEAAGYVRATIEEHKERIINFLDREGGEREEVARVFTHMKEMIEGGIWKVEFNESWKVRYCIEIMYKILKDFIGILDIYADGYLAQEERLRKEISEREGTAKTMALPNAKFLMNRTRKYMELPMEFKFMATLEKGFFDEGAGDPNNPEHLRKFLDIAVMYSVTEHQGKKLPRKDLELRSLESYLKSGDIDILVKLARPGPNGYVIPINVRPEELESPKKAPNKSKARNLSREESEVVNYVREHGSATVGEIIESLKHSRTTTQRRLKDLEEHGILAKVKSGRAHRYFLK